MAECKITEEIIKRKVHLTLTEEEARALKAVVGNISGTGREKELAGRVFEALDEQGIYKCPHLF